MTPDEYRAQVKREYLEHRDWWTKVRGMSDDQVAKLPQCQASRLDPEKNSWSYPGEY